MRFIKYWFYFAGALGYVGLGGYDNTSPIPYNSQTIYSGENIGIKKDGNSYILQGKNLPKESEKNFLKIIFSDFKLNFIQETVSFGEKIEQGIDSEIVSSITSTNNSNLSADMTNTFSTIDLNKISMHTAHKLGGSIFVKFTYSGGALQPLGFGGEAFFNLSGEHTMSNQRDTEKVYKIEDIFPFTVPPKKTILFNQIIIRNKTIIPFKALAELHFSVAFDGYVNSKRTLYKHKDSSKFKHVSYKFGNDQMTAFEDLKTQIANRNDKNSLTDWNWNSLASNPRDFSILNHDGVVAEFSGFFKNNESTNATFEFKEL